MRDLRTSIEGESLSQRSTPSSSIKQLQQTVHRLVEANERDSRQVAVHSYMANKEVINTW